MTTLITGANGTVSSAVLSALAIDDVRALVRDPAKAPQGVPAAIGDLDVPKSLTSAFEGVDVLWLLTPMGPLAPHQSSNAIWAARQAGARHVVRMSAFGASHDAPTRNGRLHALSDTELINSGLDWTIIRPASFMQSVTASVVGDTLYGAAGDGRISLIDVADIAIFAAHVLADPAPHAARTYTLTGPTSISFAEAAAKLGIGYHDLTQGEALRAMKQGGMDDHLASMGIEYAAAFADGWGDHSTTDYADIIGRQPRTFSEFVGNLPGDGSGGHKPR